MEKLSCSQILLGIEFSVAIILEGASVPRPAGIAQIIDFDTTSELTLMLPKTRLEGGGIEASSHAIVIVAVRGVHPGGNEIQLPEFY